MDIGATGSVATNLQRTTDKPSPVPLQATVPAAPVQSTQAVPRPAAAPSLDQVKQAVQDINQSLQSLSQGIEFSIDADSKQNIIKVIDRQTKEVIRQMPSEEAIQIAKVLDQVLGKLIKEKA